jgi:hypothetical protein
MSSKTGGCIVQASPRTTDRMLKKSASQETLNGER